MHWLAFSDSRQERQWEQKQAADQAGLDAAVSIQTLLFPSLVARTVGLWQTTRLGLLRCQLPRHTFWVSEHEQ